jgi:endonuclease YncB( thermonuclease family)
MGWDDKGKRFDWLEGVTPRKRSWRFPLSWRIPIKPAAAGLAVGVLITLTVIYFPSVHLPGPISTSSSPQKRSKDLPQQDLEAEHFDRCYIGGGYNCVVDGDTFWYHDTRIRIADIDAPETHPPRCAYEAELGRRATLRLQELLNQGPFTLEAIDRDHDQYGRQLRIVTRYGASLGGQLVTEGLARHWTGSRRPWC